MATDHKAAALQYAPTNQRRARVHATLYVGDQIARVAEALEARAPRDTHEKYDKAEQSERDDPFDLAALGAAARGFFRAVTK